MSADATFEIFCVVQPGLETALRDEIQALGFQDVRVETGGIAFDGGWPDVWRANLHLRGASRVLARIGSFPVFHLAQLDKRARKFPWGNVLRQDVPVRVDVTCRNSKIYHAKAAAQRIERGLSESFGVDVNREAELRLVIRIEDNLCTISVDTSGELLHRRGFKEAVAKAPLRETLAALYLRECGFDGQEAVVDPMCGSGTFVIEAAEIAAGLAPGRSREFAFEHLCSFERAQWQDMRNSVSRQETAWRFYGSDRNAGAVEASRMNAQRAGVADLVCFEQRTVSEICPPEGEPGLVMINPPYGARIGNKKALYALYRALGNRLMTHFSGWRVGMITSDKVLAKSSGLRFAHEGKPVDHGGLKVRLYRTGVLR